MKKTILLVLLVLMVSVALVAAAPGFEKLARLSIWNRTGSTIYIKLTTPKDNGNLHYYLTIKSGWHMYTVQRELYDITYWSCGASTTGVVDIFTQLSLTFTNCAYLHDTGTYRYAYQNANIWQYSYTDALGVKHYTLNVTPQGNRQYHNMGEPSMEKVHSNLSYWNWDWEKVKGCVDPTAVQTKADYAQYGFYLSTDEVNCTALNADGTIKYVNAIFRNNIRQIDDNGNILLRWKKYTYGAPVDTAGYWYAWRLSYSNWHGYLSARDVHWLIRDFRTYQSLY
jgi:hypothetical protein